MQSLKMMNCNARPLEWCGHVHLLTKLTSICCTTRKHTTRSWRRAKWQIRLCVIIGRSGRTGLKPLCLMRYTTLLLYTGLSLTSVVAAITGLGHPRLRPSGHTQQPELSLDPNSISRTHLTPVPRAAGRYSAWAPTGS